jgi:hypothetical protein
LAEQQGTERGDLGHAAEIRDEFDQSSGCLDALLGGRPAGVSPVRRTLDLTRAADELGDDGRPALEQRRGWCVGRRSPGAVATEPLEVEQPGAQTQYPASHRACRYTVLSRNGPGRSTARDHLRRRTEHDLDARDLARQGVPGKHPLAVQATTAASERQPQRLERLRRLEPTCDAAAGQLELRPPTASAAAPG